MTSLNYRNVSFGLIGAWFTFAVGASALNLFRNDPDQLPLPLLVTALAPIVLFLLWSTFSPGFRQFANSLSAHKLTIVQTWRINGFLFIILWGFGVLPAI